MKATVRKGNFNRIDSLGRAALKATKYLCVLFTFLLCSSIVAIAQNVPYQRIANAKSEPQNWLTYGGTYSAQRYSGLKQINKLNVANLRPAWIYDRSQKLGEFIESSPIVADGIMYVTEPPSTVTALDARTGMKLWTWSPVLPAKYQNSGGHANNRGVAILDNMIYVGTIDAYLVALDAKNGALRWRVHVAENQGGHFISSAPLAIDGKVLIGTGGGETGARGLLDAYDAKTGTRLWRAWTVPQPGEPGSETWGGGPILGGDVWTVGAYDPELNLTYWGTGQPAPDFNGDERPGDNLFTCSVLAIDPDTGKVKWHFQFTPHDTHDWDSTQTPILFDAMVGGKPRKLLGFANRNGFYYTLDRTTGEFLAGMPYVKQTWADGLDAKGRPIKLPNSEPTKEGVPIYPSMTGGTNWMAPSFNPETLTFYVSAREMGGVYVKAEADDKTREAARVRAEQPETAPAVSLNGGGGGTLIAGDAYGAIRALDALTGKRKWEFKMLAPTWNSTVATAGGLVFSETDEGNIFALDADSGKLLWQFPTNAPGYSVRGVPVTYEVDGKQYLVISSVDFFIAFALF
jgi:alcohol dehydrogenase (cytochrome c)